MSILFISNSNFSPGLSGGDRIFLELLRRWPKYQPVGIMGAVETKELLQLYHLKNTPFFLTSPPNKHCKPTSFNIFRLQLTRTFRSLIYIITHFKTIKNYQTIYSVSDFYADFFPALLIKILRPRTTWIAGFFLFAPLPTDPHSPYRKNHQFIKGWLYFLSQKITFFLTKSLADYVFVTSQPDVKRFISSRLPAKNIIVIRGGVDISASSKFLKTHSLAPLSQRQYAACFIGRLHPQKGVLELIDIWKIVNRRLPQAKLAIIGNGQLEPELRHQIRQLKLTNNIDLFGFLDGDKKENIFKESCLVLHPAIYDSGGMAPAEAMAWGLPAVSFDLEALKTYYPWGMVKIPCYDFNKFARTIIKLLQDQKFYRRTSSQARQLIVDFWDWNRQAKNIYHRLYL